MVFGVHIRKLHQMLEFCLIFWWRILQANMFFQYLFFPHLFILIQHSFSNDSHSIWPHCRMAVRQSAAITKKFASSIAPHITTILVHGKQVMSRQRWTEDAACFHPVSWLAVLRAVRGPAVSFLMTRVPTETQVREK